MLTSIVTVVGSVTVLIVLIEHPQIILNALGLVQRTLTGVVGVATGASDQAAAGGSTTAQ